MVFPSLCVAKPAVADPAEESIIISPAPSAPIPAPPVILVQPVVPPVPATAALPSPPPLPAALNGMAAAPIPAGALSAKTATAGSAVETNAFERWLQQVDAQFRIQVEEQAEKPFLVALETARRNYLRDLDLAASLSLRDGRAVEGQALHAEREKFLASKSMVPVDDTDLPVERVRMARAAFRHAVTTAYKDRLARVLPVFRRYEGVLAQNTVTLTQKQMQAEANLLGAKLAEISRTWLSPRSPFLDLNPAQLNLPMAPKSVEDTVAWVLRSGGRLTVKTGRKSMPVIGAKDLPKSHSEFEELLFTGRKLAPSISEESFSVLAGLGTVRSVRFAGVPVGNTAFHFLRGWKSLESLTIETALVTDPLADHLLQLSGLRTLSLENCRGITPQFLRLLQGALPNLETLVLSGTSMSDDCIPLLNQFTRLRSLTLNHTEITDQGLLQLPALPQLRELHLLGAQVTLDGLASLRSLRVDTLGFLSTDMPDFGPAARTLSTMLPHLTGLAIGGTEISVENIEALAVFKPLKTLDLIQNAVAAPAIEAASKLHGLETLSSSSRTFNDWCLVHLPDLRELKTLAIANAQISDGGILHLRNCRKLRSLDVSHTSVTASGAATLERSTGSLTVLR